MCRSRATAVLSCGAGASSLQPWPARSYAQTRVVSAVPATIGAHIGELTPRPLSRTTVGLPAPRQVRCSR